MGSPALTAITACCWTVIAAAWILGALRGRRHIPVERQEGHDRVSWLAAAASVAVLIVPHSIWQPFTVHATWVRALGLILLLPGTAAALWARAALGAMWSSGAVTRQAHTLRTSGPYQFTRHPIYTAILATGAGSALTLGLGRWLVLLVVVTVALLAKTRSEERLLTSQFPDEYPRYQQQVPRLIPRPHRRPGSSSPG